MGSIEKRTRIDKRTGKTIVTWQIRWREPGGKQKKQTCRRRVDADRELARIEASIGAGSYMDPSAGRQTFAEYASDWLDRQVQLRPSTRERYRGILAVHLVPEFGRVPLNRVERSAVTAWLVELSGAGKAGATVRHVHRVLTMILNSAIADGKIVRNPAAGVPLPRAKGRAKRFLSHAEVASLVDAAGNEGTVIRVLAYCGLRFGELAALRVRDVDLTARRLTVARSVTEVAGRLVEGPPKSGAARSVPIPRSLVPELEAAIGDRGPDALLFTSPQRAQLWLRNWRRRVFEPAVAAAGLDDVTVHSLRHTAASLAVAAGADVKVVQRMLGHASAAMTLDVYSGLFERGLDDVADALDAAAGRANP